MLFYIENNIIVLYKENKLTSYTNQIIPFKTLKNKIIWIKISDIKQIWNSNVQTRFHIMRIKLWKWLHHKEGNLCKSDMMRLCRLKY